MSELRLVDPAFLFPGISLLFLAYTNRYLALANIVRQLNQLVDENCDVNRLAQIQNLKVRIRIIKFMQLFGVVAFIFCVLTMMAIYLQSEVSARVLFMLSLVSMLISLSLSFAEILQSGKTLDIELERTRVKNERR